MHFHTLYFSELKHISLLLLSTVTACASTARVLSSVGLLDWCLFGLLFFFEGFCYESKGWSSSEQ